MEPLGRFPRVLNGVPRENIEGPPRPDPRPKTRGAAGPEGFWPRVWPRGAFNILSMDSIELVMIRLPASRQEVVILPGLIEVFICN